MAQTIQADGTAVPLRDQNARRVLVAYATKYGSTEGVAERIAANLREGGSIVDLDRADDVVDLTTYDAVVFGSPVFNQRWLPEADRFVAHNLDALAGRPVRLFSIGTFGDRKRIIGRLMRREPKRIRFYRQAIHPRGYRVFAGVIDRHQWPFLSRLFYYALGGHLGDNRDWADIDAWAGRIRRLVRSSIDGRVA